MPDASAKRSENCFTTNLCFEIQGVVNSTRDSAQSAADFIGAGSALGDIEAMRPVDAVLISTPDDQIRNCSERLAASMDLAGSVVFHLSGAQSSAELESAAAQGASVASAHPLISVAAPRQAADTFNGICCAIDGDKYAVAMLRAAFESIGAAPMTIDSACKSEYHAGAVFASNFVIALLDIGQRLVSKAIINEQSAQAAIQPLVAGNIANVFSSDASSALTGPIARGDAKVVRMHLASIENSEVLSLYRLLGMATVRLARRKGDAAPESLDEIADLLLSSDCQAAD